MAMLTRNDKILCAIYAVIALVALVATWWNNIRYVTTESTSLIDFVQSGYANYASSSLTNDLLLFGLAAFVFMVVEARRIGIPKVWIYLVLSALIAVSVAFPLFLIRRQLVLADRRAFGSPEGAPQ
ncbi:MULTISPECIES: DUF2834 domain-containing protein [Mycolicibacterium]|uniref:Protein of uncharacterized function (DUF2834) n=1 Tax=Mycolicibacterium senegalense TaxID=1796 RepID=A0A378W806_9MYCO|nr:MULTISPECIES: DUF2834 domain-containing protein [Mycolicibacterium]MCV7333555.1 DUF2834 domain-containing protein [Mycolicibacterium senegalense]MDR7288026.1 hypothetical protein [Mycolicibacterium senegalense]QZA25018.1 DUF2834 domain-containing protein [Mycolicibacterium senegalense]CDP86197.1 hypothetical protein BN975_02761 [Mycolicibacterium farcinogenes]SUA28398.1 Protein of uncharacterised function (DUF2834) [Mycolicibacterium senegalense]